MSQCKREGCDKELVNPRALFCGDACRVAHARSAKKSPEQTLPEQSNPNTEHVASLEDYHKNPKDYALRGCAELLNWGPWMSKADLESARLSGNRVAVPGDWDYKEGN